MIGEYPLVIFPDKIETALVPGRTLIPVGDVIEARGDVWLSYIPEDQHDGETIIVERSGSGKLIRTR